MSYPSVEELISALDSDLASWVRDQWQALNDQLAEADRNRLQPCLTTLPGVFAASEFVARSCVARPDLVLDLVESGDLFKSYERGSILRRTQALNFDSEATLIQGLRLFKQREAVRIAWRDLAQWADLEEVMADMTELADACITRARNHAYEELASRIGTPIGAVSGEPVELTILALGKLGGRELNFSSDIDLIFAYAEAGETDHASPKSNHEFFLKLAQRLIHIVETTTEDGLLFRVDMRLRPNGKSGPLTLSFDATEQYYQTHGRDWERYALIKARPITGDAGSTELMARLKPFIYRRYLDYGAFEAVRSMKEMISKELLRKGVHNNIKLGQGGIREIEFIAQSFQLIRGGREPQLQTNSLLRALKNLSDADIITHEMCEALTHAYFFLRRLENRLQMLRDQQVHRIPESTLDQKRLLVAMNLESQNELSEQISEECTRVHYYFQQTFVPDKDTTPREQNQIADLWLGLLDSAVAHAALSGLGYKDTSTVITQLRGLRNGRVYNAYSNIGRGRLDQLVPLLIREAGTTPNPDIALHRCIEFIEGVGRRSAYLVLLIENKLALTQLVRLISASAWVSSWIRQHPLLLDELLDPITANMGGSRQFIDGELEPRLQQIEVDDLESQMEVLREIRHGQSLRIAAADVSGLIDWVEVGRRLSMLAETMLEWTIRLCAEGLAETLGYPRNSDSDEAISLGVVAYGKLGSTELGYHSDLDIVFVHEGGEGSTEGGSRSVDNTRYFLRLVQRIVNVLTTRTAAGVLYEIDMRLRPSGRSGPVVTNIESFANYQFNNAWNWEHQALVRARMVLGPQPLRARFEETRHDVLCQSRNTHTLKEDIRDMRLKMSTVHDASDKTQFDLKHGAGGIVDIEFLVQFFVLNWAHAYPDLIVPRNTIELIHAITRARLVESDTGAKLADAYYCYLAAEHQAKLAEKPPFIPDSEFLAHREHVKMLWHSLFD